MRRFANSSSLANDPLTHLLRYCHTRRYPNNSIIVRPGDSGDTLHYIIEGSCSVSIPNKNNSMDNDIVLAYLNKGDFIGEMGVFIGSMTREVNVRTREASQLAEIGYARLHHLLNHELRDYAPEILALLGRQLSHRLLHTSRKVSNLVFCDVSSRIAHALVELTKLPDAMTHPDGMQIRVTRQELGRLVGCSREMAGRVLKEMAGKGLVQVKGKTIVVYGTR